jgi:hypothetical protein
MKTLDEYNEEALAIFTELNTYPQPNGIACPKCGKEMLDMDCMVLCSNPPKKNIGCECGYRDYRFA